MGELDRNGFAPCPQGQQRAYIDHVIKAAVIREMCLGDSVEAINRAIAALMPNYQTNPSEFALWRLAFLELRGEVSD